MTIRTAIAGTGGIAGAHIEALTTIEGVEVVAAIDVDLPRARAFADRWGIASAYSSLAAALDDTSIDVVHVCTPPSAHCPLAAEALAADVHVLIEKPPALSLAEQAALVEADRRSAATASVVFQHRFGSAVRALRGLVAQGVLGRPTVATCDTQWFRSQEYYDVPWRGNWDAEGGGPTMGHGIHQFDLLLSVLGSWRRVSAFTATRARDVETEDVSVALVEFGSGALATLVNSVVSPREASVLRFDFEFATVELSHLYGYTDADWTFTPASGYEHLTAQWDVLLSGGTSNHEGQLREYYAALAAGRTPPVAIADTTETLELAAGIYASAASGNAVDRVELDASSPFWKSMRGTGEFRPSAAEFAPLQ